MTATLSDLTDDDLAALYASGSEGAREAVLAECARQDARNARAAHARRARQFRTSDWECGAYAQYQEAERVTNGYLLSPAGEAAGIDPWPALWRGPEQVALKYASEELRNFWLDHSRVTVTAYAEQAARGPEDDYPTEPIPVTGGSETAPAPSAAATLKEALAANRQRRAVALASAQAQAEAALGRTPERMAAQAEVAVQGPAGLVPVSQLIDGNELLGYVRAFLSRFCRFPSEEALTAVALWVAHCHATDPEGVLVWEATGRLMFVSSDPDSGKSRALSLVAMLTGSRFGTMMEPTCASVAAIVGTAHEVTKADGTVIGKAHEAACLDESDLLLGKGTRQSALRALLNAGYQRDGHMPVMRGSTLEARPVFGPCALAGLDVVMTPKLKPLITRSVVIRMVPSAERVPAPGRQARDMALLLHRALTAWCVQERDALAGAEPALPDHLINRDVDIWVPLLAIAEAAGGEWPERARRACDAFTQGSGAETDGFGNVMDELAAMTERWMA